MCGGFESHLAKGPSGKACENKAGLALFPVSSSLTVKEKGEEKNLLDLPWQLLN